MELNKTMYDDWEGKIKKGNLRDEELQHFSENAVNYFADCYIESKASEMEKQLGRLSRFQILLSQMVENRKSYYIGILEGIQKTFQVLLLFRRERASFDVTMRRLSQKANVNSVLEYLYNHPDSQHKIIADELGINKGYLTQILKELSDVGCVERFATGKRSFFSLSLDGQAFIKQKNRYGKQQKQNYSNVSFIMGNAISAKYYINNPQNAAEDSMAKYNNYYMEKEEIPVG